MYAQNLMRTRLLASALVLLLSGADSSAALICAASCMSTSPVARVSIHHHEMETPPSAPQVSRHAHHHGPPCAECPPKAEASLSQSSDCAGSSDIQARSETSLSLDGPGGAVGIFAALPDEKLTSDCGGDYFLFCASTSTIRSSSPPLLPLRI